MWKLPALTMLLLLCVAPAVAAPTSVCPGGEFDGSYVVKDVASIDAFAGCTAVTGDFKIEAPSVISLAGLGGLTRVGGDLVVKNSVGLTSLDGLNSVTSVGGLIIDGNPALSSLAALAAIQAPKVRLILISRNPKLANLDGLGGMTGVDWDLNLDRNGALTTITALKVTSVGGSLRLSDNPSLKTLDGLSSLTTVGDGVYITRNSALTSLRGLGALTAVGGVLGFSGNAELRSLDGLGTLASTGSIYIDGNPRLATLKGMDGLKALIQKSMTVYGNALLPDSEVRALAARLGARIEGPGGD